MNVCDACDGEDQKPYESLKFSGLYRDWLCGVCRSKLLTAHGQDVTSLPARAEGDHSGAVAAPLAAVG